MFLERGLVAHAAALTVSAILTKSRVLVVFGSAASISLSIFTLLLPAFASRWSVSSFNGEHSPEALFRCKVDYSRMWLSSECAFHCADYVQDIGSVLACGIRQVITDLDGV